MKVAVQAGRLGLVVGDSFVDAESASGGAIPADPSHLFAHWDELTALAGGADPAGHPQVDPGALDLPVPVPRQAIGIGVNYLDHATESAMALPTRPMVFPKFASCIVGPNEVVRSDAPSLDWEAELVVVIGRDCRDIDAEHAWDVIAGLTVGQDLSDREVQFEGGANPQMGLGKSAPGYGPIGPWLVSTDEFRAGDGSAGPALDIRCEVNGVAKQVSNTRNLIFDIGTLIAYLSSRMQLLTGDVIFTGTPEGVGWGRDPKEFLRAGDVVTTTIDRIGTITTRIEAR